ncbi:helix-turn-helix transcriptional regulator [Bradyrhizobium sp. SYSU BS000235]|uniref:helix-turn-helix transcriptional regulator n=1 Tax=Bradyrhizobium sp. SYSU BS000235 TaxID=3411332 RepID=UPI003C7206FA
MGKIVFSSDQLSPSLDDDQRFSLWCDLHSAQYGLLDFARAQDREFSAHMECTQFGPVATGWFEGALSRIRRTAHEVSLDARDELILVFNRGETPILIRQQGRETLAYPGMAAFLNYYEIGESQFGDDHSWMAFTMPRDRLRGLVRNVEDLVATPLNPQSEAMSHLRNYANFLRGETVTNGESALAEHIGNSVLGLVALAIGASNDEGELAGMRGLRAARLRAVLAEIDAGFSGAGFSLDSVAGKLGLSPRYVQDLLQDTGMSFVPRVTELRLQRACRMLADHRCDRMTIGDIAEACGFSEAAYFNRCFRKRFHMSPTSFRLSG